MDRATVSSYEQHANEWERLRSPRALPAAERFAGRVGDRGPTADLGCGPGWYTAALAPPVVALDAAAAMLARTGAVAPGALRVQADLGALPFRRGALRGAWAHNSYVHLPRTSVPMALADLHRSLAPGAPVSCTFFGGDQEFGPVSRDDIGGRSFSLWDRDHVLAVLEGAGFTVDDCRERRAGDEVGYVIDAVRARTLADTVGPGMRLLLCGLNPSLYSADAGAGFARPGNRFWPAAIEAELVTRPRDPWHALRVHRVGMTDVVKRASVSAADLTVEEYRAGVERVDRLCGWLEPGAVCMVGLAGWRAAVDRRAVAGVQERRLGGRPVFVMPNTSGLNAHARLGDLVDHLRAAAALA